MPRKKKEKPPRMTVAEQLHMIDQIHAIHPPPDTSVTVFGGGFAKPKEPDK